MLEIRTVQSPSKGIRVDLFRKYKHIDAHGKPKTAYKQVGSFLLSKGYSSDLLEILQPNELLQLKNWLAEAQFAEQFNIPVNNLEKFILRMPQPLYDALIQLSLEAKRVEIDFIPHKVMLDSLLHSATLLQRKIDKINGFNSNIIESLKLTAHEQELETTEDEKSNLLFKALLQLNQPIGRICTELEKAAKSYGKVKKIPPPQLKEWAGILPMRNPNKRIKKWAYAIAIDVLHQYGINPIQIVLPEKVAEYWAIQRQDSCNLKEAIAEFIKTFEVSNDIKPAVIQAITQVYKRTTAA